MMNACCFLQGDCRHLFVDVTPLGGLLMVWFDLWVPKKDLEEGNYGQKYSKKCARMTVYSSYPAPSHS